MSVYSITNYNSNTAYTTQISPKYRSSLRASPDTFGLSDKKNKEKSSQTRWKKLLWGGGVLTIVYGMVVGHRALTKPSIEKVAKNFSEIFRKDVSKEEAQKLVNDYKELLNTEDVEQFTKKAFEQVKKDYGYENLPIKLQINKVKDYLSSSNASWNSEDGVLSINILTDKNGKVFSKNKRERKVLLQIIIHEFQHTKQTEISYRTSRNDTIMAIINQKKDNSAMINQLKYILSRKSELEKEAKKCNKSVEEYKKICEELINKLEKNEINLNKIEIDKNSKYPLDNLFENYEKFAKDSEEYKLGLKYIDNTKNYILPNVDRKGYENQILEAEAKGAENKFDEIYNYFANIWRIPFFQ